MFSAVTGVGEPKAGWNPGEQFASAGAFGPEQGLQIYQRGYLLRLLQCLRAEYSAVSSILGRDLFDQFAMGYLRDTPSQSYSLSELGAGFPDWLEDHRPDINDAEPQDWVSLMIDLMRLERVYHEVFRDQGPEPDEPCSPLEIAEAGPNARPRLVKGARTMRLRAPLVDAFLHARAGDSETHLPQLADSAVLLFRNNYDVQVISLEPWESDALALLNGEASIEDVSKLAGSLPALQATLVKLARTGCFTAVD